jgi:hypothetical protein
MKIESSQFQRLRKPLAEAMESSKDIDSAAPALLEIFARSFHCQWATYWKVDSDQLVLRAIATWCEDPTALAHLLLDTKTRALAMSEGAAGHVWRSGKPICTSDLIRDMCLPRSLEAKSGDLSGGIWFPVRAQQVTHGIIELLGRHSWPNDEQFLDQLVIIGGFIGEMLPERWKNS